MDFIIKFVTRVVAGPKNDDLVIFGPPMVRNGQKIALQAWVPKNKKPHKGSDVMGIPTIEVKENAQIVKSYKKDGVEVALSTWQLEVVLKGDYSFTQPKTVSLEDFFRDKA